MLDIWSTYKKSLRHFSVKDKASTSEQGFTASKRIVLGSLGCIQSFTVEDNVSMAYQPTQMPPPKGCGVSPKIRVQKKESD